jgi:O-glycosyl hydrolase
MKQFTLYLLLFLLPTSLWAKETKSDKLPVNVTINPAIKYQVLEGWGGSLCWWANVMGGYSDEKIKTICNWITNPVSGLNMNIFRFNIGGGDAPSHNHMRTDGGAMPGYKDSLTAPYNWNQDANQRKILQHLIASRIANTGVNDVKIVGFSNSPPWWMTVSGCVAGSTEGNTTNLRPDMFDDFADYLTNVTMYYHDKLGITFDHLEPFNEPFSTWWKANKKEGQEGCYFSQIDQEKMIRELYRKLSQKNMLSYCSISAMDANSIDEEYAGLLGYKSAGDILSKISRIDVHSYAGTQRTQLCDFARENKIELWQSESGPLSVGGTDEHQMLVVAERIITDLREMKCTAWVDWQLANDKSPIWGLIIGTYSNPSNPVVIGPSFYLRAQYSRYLKAGYTVIKSSAPNSVAAISPDKKELVVVISNKKLSSSKYKIDLSLFNKVGKVKQIRTCVLATSVERNATKTLNIKDNRFAYDALPQSVTTFIIPINQPH